MYVIAYYWRLLYIAQFFGVYSVFRATP